LDIIKELLSDSLIHFCSTFKVRAVSFTFLTLTFGGSKLSRPTGLERLIAEGLCTSCGACVAACPRGKLFSSSDDSSVVRKLGSYMSDVNCLFCGLCYETCPLTHFPRDEIEEKFFGRKRKESEEIGVYRGCYFARSTNKEILAAAQDGGAVTSLLAYGLRRRKVDCTVAAGADGDGSWRPKPVIAKTIDELIGTAASKYTPCPTLASLKLAAGRYVKNRVAVAGLPCHIWAIRKTQMLSEGRRPAFVDSVEFTVGIFCHSLFHYNRFMNFVRYQGIDPANVSKFTIKKGRFSVLLKEGKEILDLSAIELAKEWNLDLECCLHCTDYLAEFADISVGGFGSPSGWSTIITRSDKGDLLLNEACKDGFLECVKQDDVPRGLFKLTEIKKRKARKPYIPGIYEKVLHAPMIHP